MLFLLLQGVYSQFVQAVVLRELVTRFAGLELTVVVALSFMLFWTGIGCLIASGLSSFFDRRHDFIVSLLLFLSPLAALGQIACLYLMPALFGSRLGTGAHINDLILFSILIPLPFGLVNGAVFGMLTSYKKRRNTENNYSVDAVGDMLGGLAFSLFFATIVLPMAFLGGAGLLILIGTYFYSKPRRGRFAVRFIGFVLTAIVVIVLAASDSLLCVQRWHCLLPEYQYEKSIETPYGRVDVLSRPERANEMEQTVFYKNGALLGSVPVDSELDCSAAVWAAMQPNKKELNVLVSASAFSAVPKILLGFPVVRKLDFVNAEKQLLQMSDKVGILPSNHNKMTVINRDFREYLASSSEKYDLILVLDECPDTFAGNRFFTVQFYEQVAASLVSDGVFVTGMETGGHYSSEAMLRYNSVIIRTIQSAFKHIAVTPGVFMYIAAGNGGNITDSFVTLDNRIEQFMPDNKQCPPGILEVCYSQSAQQSQLRTLLEYKTRDTSNSDFAPLLPFYYMAVFAHESSGNEDSPGVIAVFIDWAAGCMGRISLVGSLLYLFIRLVLLLKNRNSYLIAFNNGFFAMGIEIILLLLYQNQYGILYQNIAAALGLFIGGTAFGAMIKSAKVYRWVHSISVLYISLLLLPGMALGNFFSLYIFTGLVLIGASVGMMYRQIGSGRHYAYNWTWEIAGGAAAGLLTSLLLLPFFGIHVVIFFIVLRAIDIRAAGKLQASMNPF